MLRIGLIFSLLLTSESYSADLRDLRFSDNQINLILDNMETSPEQFFHSEVSFTAGITKESFQEDVVYGVEIVKSEDKYYQLVALLRDNDNFYFRFLDVNIESNNVLTKVAKDIALKDVEFIATASLTDRLLVLENKELGIKKIYPIGVGSLNEGYKTQKDEDSIQSLSPEYRGASLKREDLWLSRKAPKYYKGRPFLRVTSAKGNYTAFGFHIVQDTWRLNDITRGYTSRGCVRMREHDLYEFAMILKYGKLKEIPLDITYDKISVDHPIVKVDSYYYRPKNFGTKKNPEFRRDPIHNFLILEKVKKPVPYDKLGSSKSFEEQKLEDNP